MLYQRCGTVKIRRRIFSMSNQRYFKCYIKMLAMCLLSSKLDTLFHSNILLFDAYSNFDIFFKVPRDKDFVRVIIKC